VPGIVITVTCLNPALDITHEVDGVDWSGVNRPGHVRARPGGKGLNVARTLLAIGARARVLGLAGGATGADVTSALAGLGVPATFSPVGGETRRTFAVVDTRHGRTALFNEPGPEVTPDEYAAFLVSYEQALADSAAVVLSGSLPRGLPAGAYAELVAAAAAAGVPAVLDTSGEALSRGAAARPAIVKPNVAELEALTGRALTGRALAAADGPDLRLVSDAATQLRLSGPEAVVVSLGPAGLWAATAEGAWRAVPPGEVFSNPTGAGDAVTAGLAHGLVQGQPWPERLRHAAALGTAAAAAPVAGEFSAGDYQRVLAQVTVSRAEYSA
jgi:tagatose 6-phosphate kinase